MIGDGDIPCGFNPAVPARLTPALLRAAVDVIEARYPDALLVKNQVGNLAVVSRGDEFLGFVDLRIGEVMLDGETVVDGDDG